jgi:hypothetical protein
MEDVFPFLSQNLKALERTCPVSPSIFYAKLFEVTRLYIGTKYRRVVIVSKDELVFFMHKFHMPCLVLYGDCFLLHWQVYY